MAKKVKPKVMRKFIVNVEVYERYMQGEKIRRKLTALNIAELYKKLKKFSCIDFFVDMEEEGWDKKSDKELIDELEMCNGDGGDLIVVDEMKGCKLKRIIGYDDVEEEESEDEW